MMKIAIKGAIVRNDDKEIYDWCGLEATCPNDVAKELERADGEDLEIEINSGGGDVYSGSEIYTMLKNYTGKTVVKIVGIAASAASVIAMAGKTTLMSPTAQIMVHNVWSYVQGDYKQLEHEARTLKGHNISIANAYMLKTGKTQKELLKLMDETTYLNAQEALKQGFVDEIMFDEDRRLVASVSDMCVLPKEVINKVRNQLKNQQKENSQKREQEEKQLYKAKLNFLKLKGGY